MSAAPCPSASQPSTLMSALYHRSGSGPRPPSPRSLTAAEFRSVMVVRLWLGKPPSSPKKTSKGKLQCLNSAQRSSTWKSPSNYRKIRMALVRSRSHLRCSNCLSHSRNLSLSKRKGCTTTNGRLVRMVKNLPLHRLISECRRSVKAPMKSVRILMLSPQLVSP